MQGDLVALGAGQAVPADCRINKGRIEVDQAALTGESLPVTMTGGSKPKMGSTVTRGEVEATVEARARPTPHPLSCNSSCCSTRRATARQHTPFPPARRPSAPTRTRLCAARDLLAPGFTPVQFTGMNTFFGKTAAMIQSVEEMSHFQKARPPPCFALPHPCPALASLAPHPAHPRPLSRTLSKRGHLSASSGSCPAFPSLAQVLLKIMFFLLGVSFILCGIILLYLLISGETVLKAISYVVVLLVASIPLAMEARLPPPPHPLSGLPTQLPATRASHRQRAALAPSAA